MLNLSDIIWLDESGDGGRSDSHARRDSFYRCSYVPYFFIQYQGGQAIQDV